MRRYHVFSFLASLALALSACGEPGAAVGPGSDVEPPATAPPLTAASSPATTPSTPATSTTTTATTPPATAAAPTTAVPTSVPAGIKAASVPYPRFDVDRGTAVAAVDLDLEEAYRISDEFEAPWDPDLSLDACDEIYPGTYALRFTIAEDAGFAYPAELAVMPLTFSGDMGFPVGAQRVTVSGPGTFATVFSIRALFDAERDGAAAFLVEDLELYFEEECDAVVLDLSGSGLGRDFLSSEPLTTGITPMPPLPTAPEGTVQHLAETADWDPQGDHPWRVLANVHGYQGSHFFADRLMLPADGWVMLAIEETLIDGCYAVQSAYSSTSDGLTRARLDQVEAGCEAQFGWTLVESGEDWTVAVAVPDGFDFAGVLRWFDNATPRDPAERAEVAAYYP